MATSSETAAALQLEFPPWRAAGLLWCAESPGGVSGAGEEPLSAGGFPEGQALEQGPGSPGVANCDEGCYSPQVPPAGQSSALKWKFLALRHLQGDAPEFSPARRSGHASDFCSLEFA